MTTQIYTPLPSRGLIQIKGPDAHAFLQGLVSQDITRVNAERAVYSAFLTPQGKFLFDFFACEWNGALIIDCEGERRSDFFKRLSMYKLRSDVELSDITDAHQVYGILAPLDFNDRGDAKSLDSGVIYADPRLKAMGCRAILPKDGTQPLEALALTEGSFDDYERQRIQLGLADGSRDMKVDRALLLENGFEELDGVNFSKGCFMGQELTARTRYRALVKKRLLPVSIDGAAPESGTKLMSGDTECGEMRSSIGGLGLALVRLDRWEDGQSLTADGTTITPYVPDWVQFQDKPDA